MPYGLEMLATDLFGSPANGFHMDMPQPQYLGAKYNLLGWIRNYIPRDVKVILDGFAGSQSVAFDMKKLGYEVHTNDFMNFSHQSGLALIENKNSILTQNDIKFLFNNKNNNKSQLVSNLYKDIFFEEEECKILDEFRENVELLDCKYKQALALAVMNRSLTRKTLMGHFAHTKALDYAKDELRIKRNPSIAKSPFNLFMSLVDDYNSAVFDNKKSNKSYNENILELLPKLKNIDLAYYDPPYCNSHSDYQSFYHLLETFVQRWEYKEFINGTKRYHPPVYSGFDKVKDIENSFNLLFELSKDIPYWLISYNNRSVPTVGRLVEIISKHRKVVVHEKEYKNSRGGKGSVSGSREYLLFCE